MSAHPKKMPANQQSAPLLRRLAAYMIDWYLATMVCGAPLMLVNSMRTGLAAADSSLPPGTDGWIWGLAAIALGVFYYWGLPVVWKGCTPGKRLLHLRVVKYQSEDAPLPRDLLLRQVVGVLLLEGAVTFPSQLLRELLARLAGEGCADAVRIGMVAVTVLSILIGAYTPGRRMLHDRISGTMEVMEKC